MAKTWTNINDWIRDMNKASELFDETHLRSRLGGMDKTPDQIKAYEELIQAGRGGFGGKEGHRLSTALSSFQSAARDAGFGKLQITQEGEQSYRLSFLPTHNSENIGVDECPSLIISNTNDYGLTVQNQLPSISAMMVVRKESGEIGLASAAAVGIDEATSALRRVASGVNYQTASLKQQAKTLKTSVRINSNDVLKKNPMASSRRQQDSFRDALNLDKMSEIRSEQAKLTSGQVYTANYYKSLLNAKKKEIYGYNEQLEKQIYRELANFEHHAKNFTEVKELQEYLRQSQQLFPLINKYLWKGELENLYKGLYSVGLTFGGKTEGTAGIFSLFNAPVPGYSILPKSSRKVAQNLRILQKGYKQGQTKGFAPNLIHLPGEFSAEEFKSGDAFKNLYITAELTEEDIKKGAQKYLKSLLKQADKERSKGDINLKNLYRGNLFTKEGKKIIAPPITELMKGVTNDAEIYANQIAKDFKVSFEKQEKIERIKVTPILDQIAKRYLTETELDLFNTLDPVQKFEVFKNGQIRIQENGQEVNKTFVGQAKGKKTFAKDRSKLLNSAILQALDLNPNDSNNFIRDVIYDSEIKSYIANVKKTYDTKTATVRGGATSDNRAVVSNISDELFASILKAAGYSNKEIWNKDGTLNITHARLARDFENKTAHTDFMGMTQYIVSKLYNKYTNNQQKSDNHKALEKIVKDFNEGGFTGLLSIDPNGGFKWNEEVLKQLLEQRKADNGIAGLIRDIGNFGARLGVYTDRKGRQFTGDIFSIKDGVLQLNNQAKFLTAQELGISSGPRYQGVDYKNSTGEETGMRIDRRVVDNLYNTAGKMRASGPAYAAEAALIQAQADKYNEQLTALEEKFKPYERNLNFLTRTGPSGLSSFEPDQEEAIRKLEQVGGIVLNAADFIGAKDLNEYEYGKLAGKAADSYQGRIQRAQREQYGRLFANYLDLAQKNNPNLSQEELGKIAQSELEKRGIYSASDIQVALKPGKDVRYNSGTNTGGLIMLGRGDIHDVKSDTNNEYFSEMDEIAMHNTRMVRDFLKFESGLMSINELGRVVRDYTEDTVQAMRKNGSVWEKYHSFKDTNGGQFLLQGTSANLPELIKQFKKDGIVGDDFNISGVMNAGEYGEILLQSILGSRKDANTDELKAFDDFYAQITGRKNIKQGFGKISEKVLKSRIREITNALNIDNPNTFKGKTSRNIGLYRAPIIKGVNDIIKGGFVVSNNVERGNIMLDPATAAIMKGDFDGDRIAVSLYKAALTGDNRYFDWMSEQQRAPLIKDAEEIRQKYIEGKSGSVDKINVPFNDELVKIAATNAGKKGSGIFGDTTIGWQSAIHQMGIDWSTVTSEVEQDVKGWLDSNASQQITPALAGELFTHVVGSLYQNAINIKNLKTETVTELQKKYSNKGFHIYPDAQATLEKLVKEKESWDNESRLSDMIELMQDMGMLESDDKKLFKSNILGELGLNLSDTPENFKKALGELFTANITDPEQRQQAIVDFVKNFNTFDQKELLNKNFLTNVGKYLGATIYNKNGKTIGDIFSNVYKYIEGRENKLYNVFGDRTEDQIALTTDAAGIKRLKEAGIYRGLSEDGKVLVGHASEGWAKWEEDLDSRLDKRLERLKKRDFETDKTTQEKRELIGYDNGLLNSSTVRVRKLLNKGPSNEVFPKAAKFIEDIVTGQTEDNFDKNLDLWKNSYQGEFSVLKSIFTGNLVHRMAEIAGDALKETDEITEKDLTELLAKDSEYNKISKELDTLYQFKFGREDNNAEFSDRAKKIGFQQLKLLQRQLANERIVGQEMSLFTSTATGELISGVADLITASGKIGGVGDNQHVLTVTDYKNYARGELSPDVILQTLQYVDSLRLIHNELKDQYKNENVSSWDEATIKAKADEFLEQNHGLSQVWRAIINDKLKTRGWDERQKDATGNASEKYKTAERQMFYTLFGELIDPNLRFKIRANIASTKDASVKSFEAFADGARGNLITKAVLGAADTGIFEGFSEKQLADLLSIMGQAESLSAEKDVEERFGDFNTNVSKLMRQYSKIEDLKSYRQQALEKQDYSAVTSLDRQIEQQENQYRSAKNQNLKDVKSSWVDLSSSREAKLAFLAGNGLLEGLFEDADAETITDEQLQDIQLEQVLNLKEQQTAEIARKKRETGKNKISEWRKTHEDIQKYQQLKTVLARKLEHAADATEAGALEAQYRDADEVLTYLQTRENELAGGFRKRDSFGNIIGEDEYTEDFKVAQQRQNVLDAQNKAKAEKEALDQYKNAIFKKEELGLRKQNIQSLLDNPEYMRSLSQNEKDQLQDQLKDIDRAIEQYTEKAIESVATITESMNPEIAKERKAIEAKLGHKNVNALVVAANTKLATITKEQQDYHSALQEYAALENAKRQVNIIDQKIARSMSDDQRTILELEKRSALDQQAAAQAAIDKRETIASVETDPANKAYQEEINRRALEEAKLRTLIQDRAYKEQTRNTGILGIADKGLGQLLSRFIGGQALYRLLGKFKQTLSQLTNEAKALDKALTNLRIVTGDTKDNTRGLITQYSNLAQTLGVTTKAVATSAVEWLRQGYSTSEAMDLIKSSMYLSTLGMIDSAQATKSLYSRLLM